jgi:hypothetical protein
MRRRYRIWQRRQRDDILAPPDEFVHDTARGRPFPFRESTGFTGLVGHTCILTYSVAIIKSYGKDFQRTERHDRQRVFRGTRAQEWIGGRKAGGKEHDASSPKGKRQERDSGAMGEKEILKIFRVPY